MTTNDDEQLEVLDVEEHERGVSGGQKKPRARRYRIRVDRERYETTNPTPTGREILALASMTPETRVLSQMMRGGAATTIEADQVADLRAPGVERFTTIPREATEGRELRRQFTLPKEDLAFLEGRGEPWEAIADGGSHWVLLERFKLPAGYSVVHATAAVQMVGGYPEAQLDMMYFDPHLMRADGRTIGALSTQAVDGRTFQRWSRHRPPTEPWRVGVDGLESHCAYAYSWLAAELQKR